MFVLPNVDHISEWPGVYIFRDIKKSILYVGKAKNLRKRLSQYFNPGSVRKQDMLSKASDVEFLSCQSEQEALVLESHLIKTHYPPFNRLLKWDNSYVYIKITHQRFPQVFLTRYRSDDKATYIGPKNNTQELKKLIQYMRQYLQFRTCKDTQFKQWELCNDYVFGLCKWRCIYAKIEEEKSRSTLQTDQVKDDKNNGKKRWIIWHNNQNYNQILEKAKRLWFTMDNL